MRLSEVSWPAFRLKINPPEWEGDILVYKNHYLDKDSGNEYTHTKVVDSKKQGLPDNLGLRRLKLEKLGYPLFKIKYIANSIDELLQSNYKYYYWIDSKGRVFKHSGTERWLLKPYKVKHHFPAKTLGTIFEVEGIPQRFYTTYNLAQVHQQVYAGILSNNHKYLLYGVYLQPFTPTWRKI